MKLFDHINKVDRLSHKSMQYKKVDNDSFRQDPDNTNDQLVFNPYGDYNQVPEREDTLEFGSPPDVGARGAHSKKRSGTKKVKRTNKILRDENAYEPRSPMDIKAKMDEIEHIDNEQK